VIAGVVLEGMLRVGSKTGTIDGNAGQAFIAHAGAWIRYRSPDTGEAENIAVCAGDGKKGAVDGR
jgi:hypothetical protein